MLHINHLYFSYQHQPPYVLKDISLNVQRGDYISIIGENGCGKSTLVRIILGFLPPSHGTICRVAKNIRYVAQRRDFSQADFPVTVHEILDAYRHLLHIKDRHAIDDALAMTGMSSAADRLIGRLSGGQAQRVAIARALIGAPELLILDEPSTGIDVKSQQEIYALLRHLNQAHHLTILAVEHNMAAVLANSTHIFAIKDGHGTLQDPAQYDDALSLLPPHKESLHAII
jgi:zinc transport system ATP-binding protein